MRAGTVYGGVPIGNNLRAHRASAHGKSKNKLTNKQTRTSVILVRDLWEVAPAVVEIVVEKIAIAGMAVDTAEATTRREMSMRFVSGSCVESEMIRDGRKF